MVRATARALAWVGWVLLGTVALLGLALSAVAFLAAVPVARGAIASAIVGVVDNALAGSFKLERIEVLGGGGIGLRGLEVFDPDGHLVLAVGRARLAVDVRGLRSRTIGIEVELEAPSVLIAEEAGGGTSLARAFAPAHPGEREEAPGGGASSWTVQLSRLEIRGGEVWWVDAEGQTRLEAAGLDLSARGTIGPRRAHAELRLNGEVRAPLASPIALELAAWQAGDAVRVPLLRLEAGGSALSAVGDGDLAARRGRLAVTRLGIARDQARVLLPSTPEGDDLRAVGYAESDGTTLTAALRVEPVGDGAQGGRGDAAVAARLDALGRAAGFDVALERLDPSRLAASAPPGALTLTARGAVSGSSLQEARAQLALSLSRSRLRRGEVSRAEVQLRIARGAVEVDRLSAAAPGVAVSGAGRGRRGGALSASATVEATDLSLAARNLALLLGVRPPALAGRLQLSAKLSGTSAAPALSGTLDAPRLRSGDLVVDGLHLALSASGPLASAEGSAEGTMAQVREAAGRELARQVSVRAAVAGGEGTVSARAILPGPVREPLTLDARGRFGPRRETLLLDRLAMIWPGARWTLARPAAVTLRGPSVDRLELASDAQRISASGGLGTRGALAARLELSRVDLARLPPGLLPEREGIRGELSGTLEASGTVGRPVIGGRIDVVNGAWRGLAGVAATGEGRFDGRARRAAATLSVARAAGGTIDVALDLPVPLAARRAQPLKARVHAAALPVPELLAVAGSREQAAGTIALDARVEGTAGAPSIAAEVSVADGAWRDLDGIAATVTVEDLGGELHVSASGSIDGRRVVGAEAQVPLELGDLLDRPEEALRALARAPLQARANVTSLDLAALAGRAGVPEGIAGLADARADLSGTAAAPRGTATVDLSGAAWKGWRRMGAHLELSAREEGMAAAGTITAAGQEALRFEGSLGLRPERLARRDALLAAPLRIEAVIPRVALASAAGEAVPLSGTLEGRLGASGTLRAPVLTGEVTGAGVAIEGRPLGDGRATARYADRRAEAEVALRPSAGGTLHATLSIPADLGLGAGGGSLRDAPAEITATAKELDLGFLQALAPKVIRSSGGHLTLDLHVKGPLGRLAPRPPMGLDEARGTLSVAGGQLAVAELGEWTDIGIEASVTGDAIELKRLAARRGKGRVTANAAVRGLRSDTARVSGNLEADKFTVARAGMELATIDGAADATGTWRGSTLAVNVTIPHGVVRLPKKSPRTLQPLDQRKDIVVARKAEQKRGVAKTAAGPTGAEAEPFSLQAHVVVPRNFFVKSDNPKLDVELKADVRYEEGYPTGTIEVVRGTVEPIGGRNFTLRRDSKIQFTGGPPQAALLDIEATYHNPQADVTATVVGQLRKPEIHLTSKPEMEEGKIALLLATGRTELKAGSGAAASTITGEEAGRAALGAIATQAFRNLVQDKLPLDVVALEAGGFRTGKYLTDKIYVGYVRRFDADPTKNENEDEVRIEYQITPGWMFESRYGTAQSGGASLIWSKDY